MVDKETSQDFNDVNLAIKCLEITQTLVTTNTSFRLSLRLSSGFHFFMSKNQEHGQTSTKNQDRERKKKSPSTIRRNAARREEFIRKKKESSSPGIVSTDETSNVTKDDTPTADVKAQIENNAIVDYIVEVEVQECDLCDFKSDRKTGLEIHMSRKHKGIPQIDGEDSTEVRDTDCYWDSGHGIKIFGIYNNVLKDIEESDISKEEKAYEK